MNVKVRFALAVAASAGCTALALLAVGAGVWSSAGPEDRLALARVLRTQRTFLVVAALLFLLVIALLVGWFFTRYVVPLRRLAADTRLVATTNRSHRLEVAAPTDLRDLADAVNEVADRLEAAEDRVESRVHQAQAALEEERNRLAALMSELTLPVLVCNAAGRILLYNAAARELLGSDSTGHGGYVGLGRSVFGVIDRSLVTHALERVTAGSAASCSATARLGERMLRVHVAAVSGPGGDPAGFVLSLEDLTRRAAVSQGRDELLRALTEGSRSAIASIRAAAENVLDYPAMAPEQQRRFVEVIHDEARRLGEQVERTVAGASDYLTDRSLLEEVLAADLLGAVSAEVRAQVGVPASVEEPAGDLWLQVDSHAVVRAVADLAGWLHAECRVDTVSVVVEPAQGFAGLDLRWQGQAVEPGALRRWAERAGVRAVLERHGTEAWSGRDTRGPFVRLLLPLAAAVAAPRPAEAPPATTSRPQFYDFDLFRVTDLAAGWGDRRIDDLAYTVLDTETTGLNPNGGDEIVSIGAIRVVNGRLLRQETFEQLVDPRRSIPAASRAVHGITEEMVRGQPPIEDVLPALRAFVGDTALVGHDIAFDLQFLERTESRAGVRFTQPVLDTLLLSALVHPEHDEHSLEAIAGRLGVSVLGRHTALGDAIVTGEIFVRLVPLLRRRGLETLGAVRDAARATHHARRSEALYPSR